MNEKERIEHATVRLFLTMYNSAVGAAFEDPQMGDSPDATCSSPAGDVLNIEVTLTEDAPGGIAAALGRASSQLPALGHRLDTDVFEQIKIRLEAKLSKRYGEATALVIRDSSGVGWDWNDTGVRARMAEVLPPGSTNPYDKGIWVFSRDGRELFRLA